MSCIGTCRTNYEEQVHARNQIANAQLDDPNLTDEQRAAVMALWRADLEVLLDNLIACVENCYSNQAPPGDPQ
jgi:hypothetical protein